MVIERWLNVVAGLVGIVSFILAFVQTLRYRQAEKDLQFFRRSKNADIWGNIALVLQAYESLDDARTLVRRRQVELAGKLSSARRAIVGQYIQLLKQAILDEPEFTEETIQYWRRIGRLENDWRAAQAMKYIYAADRGSHASRDQPVSRRVI